jgi:hypothetical protein
MRGEINYSCWQIDDRWFSPANFHASIQQLESFLSPVLMSQEKVKTVPGLLKNGTSIICKGMQQYYRFAPRLDT